MHDGLCVVRPQLVTGARAGDGALRWLNQTDWDLVIVEAHHYTNLNNTPRGERHVEGVHRSGACPVPLRAARPRPVPRHAGDEQGHRRDAPRARSGVLRASGQQPVLTKTRWILLKRPANLTRGERHRLRDLLAVNLESVRAYLLKEEFQRFWRYRSRAWAARFLDAWIRMTMRSRIEPLKKFARTLRTYRYELDNWFFARQQLAAGAVEGLSNKARITTRKAYGFRTYEHAEIAAYHALGELPEPDWLTHRFC